MTTNLAVATDGLPIYDAVGHPLYQLHGGVVDAAGNAAVINPINGIPTDAAGLDIPQPPQLTRVNDLLANATANATLTAFAAARAAPLPTRVTFARTPGRVNRDIIDYTTKTGEALYKQAIKSLYSDGEGKFSLKDEDMLAFLNLITWRAKTCGWDVFAIPISAPATTPVVIKDLLAEYGEIPLDKVRTKAETIATLNDRTTQEDDQLFTCLMASLTKEAQNTINLKKTDFTVGSEHSGILLLKVIISKSQVDTRSTINLLMGKLTTGMADIMASHSNNITVFNAEVNETLQKLQSRGKSGANELDLIPQLFRTYMSCCTSDTPFYRYIEGLENKHNDRDITLTTKMLMDKAETKYEELKDKAKFTSGPGKGLMDNESDVVALRAEIAELKGLVAVSKKHGTPPEKSYSRRNTPEWVTEKPSDGKLIKTVKGKTYHWCDGDNGKNHAPKWVIHKPSECTDLKKTASQVKSQSETPGWTTAMIAALQANQEE